MLTFMDYIQRAFDRESKWNPDNSYSSLTWTAQSLLDFPTPHGLRLNISSLPSPTLGTSYTLSTTGLVSGSLSYLYTSLPLHVKSSTTHLNLHDVITGYRHLSAPIEPDGEHLWEIWHRGRRVDTRNVLLFGRLFLPKNRLEGLYLRRRKPTQILKVQAVSDTSLPNGGTVLAVVQNDHGKYSSEFLYSTDSSLVGVRGLWNLGTDPRAPLVPAAGEGEKLRERERERDAEGPPGLFSFGSEIYYGVLNKSFGLSTGLRFTTLPSHTGFPYTMTVTLNPLMGNLSSTYSVKAGKQLALSSRFDFNFYSYESGVMVGLELWRMRRSGDGDVKRARETLGETPGWAGQASPTLPGSPETRQHSSGVAASTLEIPKAGSQQADRPNEDVSGVLKARIDQDAKIGLLWEGRWKDLLFSIGANIDLKKREQIFRGVGLEVQYSN